MLIAAIWFVALTAFAAIIISGWMSRSLTLATRLQERLAARQSLLNAQNEFEYRLVSGFLSPRGLELPEKEERTSAIAPDAVFGFQFAASTHYIALDDRPYRMGSVVIRLQDDRGLITLNHPSPDTIGSLLSSYGVERGDRAVLIDRLLDYMGNSALQRLNGATAEDYKAAGRPPPRGAPLLTPWEALRVLSWDGYPALWREPGSLADLTTIGDAVQLNAQTAPAAVLATLPGMNADAAQRVVQYRQTHLVQSLDELSAVAGVGIGVDPMAMMFFPADAMDVTIAAGPQPVVQQFRLQLTPIAKEPFRVDYVVSRSVDPETQKLVANPKDLPEFPQIVPSPRPMVAANPGPAVR